MMNESLAKPKRPSARLVQAGRASPRPKSAFFFYGVNIVGFVKQPPWHFEAVIISVFNIPGVVFRCSERFELLAIG
jgi:hypothetical protein